MGRDLERLFERYRRRGDVRALEKVFDRTARDLLILAQHLVRNLDDAEDLVQSTFVTVIDRAPSFDGKRPLRPWLAGILARHAANLIRRRQSRQGSALTLLDEVPATNGTDGDPVRAAEAAELGRDLERALTRVSPNYRSVLEPYLVDGQRPEQIARRLGRAPGTVRTQISRGLDQLRRLLPAGVAAGVLLGPRGLSAVRTTVLQHATAHAGSAVATGALGTSFVIGGSIVAQKAVLAGVVGLAAITGFWIANPAPDESPELAVVLPAAPTSADEATGASLMLPDSDTAQSVRSARQRASETDGSVLTEEHPGRALLRGKVVGVNPEHLSELKISVVRRAPIDEAPKLPSFTHLSPIGTDDSQQLEEVVEFVRYRVALDQTRRSRELSGIMFDPNTTQELELADASVQPDGSFEFDMSGLVDDPNLTFRIRLAHEVYFDAHEDFEFPEHTPESLARGVDVVVDVGLALAPAAVLRGKLTIEAEQEVTFEAADVQVDLARAEYQQLAVRTRTVRLLETVVARSDPGGGAPVLWSFTVHGPQTQTQAALFRAGATQPLASTQVGHDGSFELRVAEEGPFVLVIFEQDRPLLNYGLDLNLLEVRTLEEELTVIDGPRIRGVVHDFGLFPEGGLTILAERSARPGDRKLRWLDRDFVWSRGELCLQRAEVRTDANNDFDVAGFTEGLVRLQFKVDGSISLFSPEELAAAAVEVPAPANDVALTMPVTILEVFCDASLAAEGETTEDWTLEIEDAESPVENPTRLASTPLDAEGRCLILARPDTELRLNVKGEAVEFETWTGTTSGIGERREARIRGSRAESE